MTSLLNHSRHSPIGNVLSNLLHEPVVGNRIEEPERSEDRLPQAGAKRANPLMPMFTM